MNKTTYIWFAALFLITATAVFVFSSDKDVISPEPVTSQSVPLNGTAAIEPENKVIPRSEPAAGDSTAKPDMEQTDATVAKALDINAALETRAIGNPDAAITVREFASLTCSHCAHFYNDTFPALKEKYIDTGKVYFIYEDFPLNAPALEASLVARCLPHNRYFKFIKFLFSTQNEWAYEGDYSSYLRQNAKLLGLNDAGYDACVNNEELRNRFGDMLAENQKEHEINSTPTFILNGTETISGAQPLPAFEQAFKKLGLRINDTEAQE